MKKLTIKDIIRPSTWGHDNGKYYDEWSATRDGEDDEVSYINGEMHELFDDIKLNLTPDKFYNKEINFNFHEDNLKIITDMNIIFHISCDSNDDETRWKGTFCVTGSFNFPIFLEKTFIADTYYESYLLCQIFCSKVKHIDPSAAHRKND